MKEAEAGKTRNDERARNAGTATPITEEEAKGVVGGTNSPPVPNSAQFAEESLDGD